MSRNISFRAIVIALLACPLIIKLMSCAAVRSDDGEAAQSAIEIDQAEQPEVGGGGRGWGGCFGLNAQKTAGGGIQENPRRV